MTTTVESSWRSSSRALALWGALWVMLAFTGCSAPPSLSSVGGTGSDLVTESDEPENRRRARIRLELAASYFDAGQTKVALDEVKQSLVADPAYPDAFNLRGLIYMRLGELEPAEESFRRAIALRPGDANLQHNYGWLLCQVRRYADADQQFTRALASPTYTARSKTLMAQGLCRINAGQLPQAEQSLIKAYELDAANPVVGYHLAALLWQRAEFGRAQFYIRRLNNSEYANAESLWLGIKIERSLGDAVAARQLADQLRKRFPDSREYGAYERGAFNE